MPIEPGVDVLVESAANVNEAVFEQPGDRVDYTCVASVYHGQVVQLADGRAAVTAGSASAGKIVGAMVRGIFQVAKTTGIALLAGGDVYWDLSANKAHFRPEAGTGDFRIGTVHSDAASADTTVYIVLNGVSNYTIDLGDPGQEWTVGSVAGTTATTINLPGGTAQLNILSTSEAQGCAVVSNRSIPASAKPIFEARVAKFSASGSDVDFDIGLAAGSHASDFETVTVFAAFHTDGGDDNWDTHSDDGTTDRAPADSTVDMVDDTYDELWVDCRDDTDVKYYINGVLVDTSASKRILTAGLTTALKAVAMVEKSTGTQTAEFRVSRMRARTTKQE